MEIMKSSLNSSKIRKRIIEGNSVGHPRGETLVVHRGHFQKDDGSSIHQRKKPRSKSKSKKQV